MTEIIGKRRGRPGPSEDELKELWRLSLEGNTHKQIQTKMRRGKNWVARHLQRLRKVQHEQSLAVVDGVAEAPPPPTKTPPPKPSPAVVRAAQAGVSPEVVSVLTEGAVIQSTDELQRWSRSKLIEHAMETEALAAAARTHIAVAMADVNGNLAREMTWVYGVLSDKMLAFLKAAGDIGEPTGSRRIRPKRSKVAVVDGA